MLHKASLILSRAATAFCVGLMFAMTAVILAGVFYRYVLLRPLPWSEDLGRYLMIYIALFGAGVVMHHKRHVAVTVAIDRMPLRLKVTARVVANCVVFGFAIAMGILGIQHLITARPQISPSLNIDLWWVYLGFPFYSALLMISAMDQIFEDLKVYRTNNPKNSGE